MHTQSAAEYWHRSGSLVHTDPLGKKDADDPRQRAHLRVRRHAARPGRRPAGPRHRPTTCPTRATTGRCCARLLDALDAWVQGRHGAARRASIRASTSGTLVDWRQTDTGFPALPGVRYPEVIQQPPALDYGPDFCDEGHHHHRAAAQCWASTSCCVPKSGRDGNDLGTLLPPEVAVPLATTPAGTCAAATSAPKAMLVSLPGSYIPFPRHRADRNATRRPAAIARRTLRQFREVPPALRNRVRGHGPPALPASRRRETPGGDRPKTTARVCRPVRLYEDEASFFSLGAGLRPRRNR